MDAFKKYNFETNEKWNSYIRSIELPGRNVDEAMLRVKARWYKKNIDPNLDLSQVLPAAGPQSHNQGSNAGTASRSASAGTGSGYSPRPSAPPPPPPPPRYGKTGSGTYGSVTAQRGLFFAHLGMLVLGIMAFMQSRTAYLYLMRLTILTMGYKIYLQHGLPTIRPMSLIMDWVQRVMLTADIQQLVTAVFFSALPPLPVVPVPLMVLAAYHVDAYCAAHCTGHPLWQKYGNRLHTFLLRKQADALMLNAYCEVLTAALMLALLFTNARSLLTLFFYAQILKLKLHVPDSAPQHRRVWRRINEVTLPYRSHVPFLERFIQLAVRWFMTVPGAH
ncbi:hypothetical protein Vretimale_17046 [Volvox reticuliferus]|uniref:Uncharacterized protein n=1 Tax=Volvox reticuliferus TaxID=1737510 RepID=A0A8J4LXE1_9CHLO|nr:hypothetical protein Vretifemale_18649 [Volvox reticuliferus]GIM14026.1 hypothetical protein Vretimale_17046 [Volvox reticuliferus]